MSAPVVSLKAVSKVFYTEEVETHALSAIDLEVREGEYVAITGPSGSGKSTLLAILGLLDFPTAGTVAFGGDDVLRLSATDRAHLRNRRLGFVFQTFNIIGDLTIQENVALPLVYGGVPAKEHHDLAISALRRVGIEHRARHYPAQLSGGEQQRAAVARAIVRKSALLLADEPTGNLDSANGEVVMQLFDELNQAGTTICLVTHDARHAARASRQVRLIDGLINSGESSQDVDLSQAH